MNKIILIPIQNTDKISLKAIILNYYIVHKNIYLRYDITRYIFLKNSEKPKQMNFTEYIKVNDYFNNIVIKRQFDNVNFIFEIMKMQPTGIVVILGDDLANFINFINFNYNTNSTLMI